MRVALVTAGHVDPAKTDDRLLAAALTARGHDVEWLAWDHAGVDWAGFDRVVLRSCWDYHRRLEAFTAWLRSCEHDGVALVNPVQLVIPNLHKRYLATLQEAGLSVPPFVIVPKGDDVRLGDLFAKLGTHDAVIKPAVSASALNTWRTVDERMPANQRRLIELIADQDMMVQAFVPEVLERGEWSLIAFGGRPSHAVLKRVKQGDFRSQAEFGGLIEAGEPPAELAALGAAALHTLAPAAAFARLDLVEARTGPLLMEVELVEPVLFFAFAARAAERFAEAVERDPAAHRPARRRAG
ncbi:MAG TPA: hypothetical protein VM616_01825 [Gammaproteobacteria bacterium]|nr:hypothetical protein [Gammaproteobacteria bacterium]